MACAPHMFLPAQDAGGGHCRQRAASAAQCMSKFCSRSAQISGSMQPKIGKTDPAAGRLCTGGKSGKHTLRRSAFLQQPSQPECHLAESCKGSHAVTGRPPPLTQPRRTGQHLKGLQGLTIRPTALTFARRTRRMKSGNSFVHHTARVFQRPRLIRHNALLNHKGYGPASHSPSTPTRPLGTGMHPGQCTYGGCGHSGQIGQSIWL